MSSLKSLALEKSPALVPDQNSFAIDMRRLLRGKKEGASANVSTESAERSTELTSAISQISLQSVQEIDHLIAGLQGIRQKLEDDGSRIQRQISDYTSFSQSVIDLTKIVSDATTAIKTSAYEVVELPTAS